MQLPQFAGQTYTADDQINHHVNNPVLNNLFKQMSDIRRLYDEFMSLHAKIFAAQHPNLNLTSFTAKAHLEKNPISISFATSFMRIMSIAGEIDLTNPQIVYQHKSNIFQSIKNCEMNFFAFNELYPPTPELLQLICQISMIFTAVKQELNRLNLFDVPNFEFSENSSANTTEAARGREKLCESEEHQSRIRRRR